MSRQASLPSTFPNGRWSTDVAFCLDFCRGGAEGDASASPPLTCTRRGMRCIACRLFSEDHSCFRSLGRIFPISPKRLRLRKEITRFRSEKTHDPQSTVSTSYPLESVISCLFITQRVRKSTVGDHSTISPKNLRAAKTKPIECDSVPASDSEISRIIEVTPSVSKFQRDDKVAEKSEAEQNSTPTQQILRDVASKPTEFLERSTLGRPVSNIGFSTTS
jgi:hypothetical protein